MDQGFAKVDRRGFLRLWGVGVAGVALPSWMAVQLAAPGPRERLARSRALAASQGRPWLVLVFPADPAARMATGEAWGQLLRFGSDELLADLAMCELACAELAVLRRVDPKLTGLPARDPLALLLDPDGDSVRAIEAELTPPDVSLLWEVGGLEPYERALMQRVERLESALRAAIAADGAMVARRLEDWRARAGAEQQREALALLDNDRPPRPQDAARYPVLARALAEGAGAERDQWLEPLARASRERLEASAPSGSRWGVNTGCGCDIEGEESQGAVACGMGMVPEIGRRFLAYWVE